MRQKLISFMRGRYGVDQLSSCLMWLACIIIFIDIFVKSAILNLIGIVIFIYAYVRIFSKKYTKRCAENTWFLSKTYKLRMKILKIKGRFKLRRTHHIYSCPDCKQKIKIPKGRGKIAITCPKCGREFIKRS